MASEMRWAARDPKARLWIRDTLSHDTMAGPKVFLVFAFGSGRAFGIELQRSRKSRASRAPFDGRP